MTQLAPRAVPRSFPNNPKAARKRTRPVQNAPKTPQEKASKKMVIRYNHFVSYCEGESKGCNMRTRLATSYPRTCKGSATDLQQDKTRATGRRDLQQDALPCNVPLCHVQ
jgi:hypothetical protein